MDESVATMLCPWLCLSLLTGVCVTVSNADLSHDRQGTTPSPSHPRVELPSALFKIIRVNETERTKVEHLLTTETYLQVLHKTQTDVDILVSASDSRAATGYLRTLGLEYEILVENVTKKMENQNPAPTEGPHQRLFQDHKLTFDRYHDVEVIYGYLDYLDRNYKDFVSLENIGTTHEGRKLKLLKVSSRKPNATAIWIDAGIHAREWVSPAAVLYVTRELIEKRDHLPAGMRELDYYILPLVNPDGYAYTHNSGGGALARIWRKNRAPAPASPETSNKTSCLGVDLNRNFDYKWGGEGTSEDSCEEDFRGPRPNSEPETIAITDYLGKRIRQFQGFLSFHAFGQYILYPWGYDTVLPADHEDLQKVGKIAAERIKEVGGVDYEVGTSAITLYPAAGGSDDWAKANGVKYCYTIELRDGPAGRDNFFLPASEIVATGKDALEVVRAVAEEILKHPPEAI